MLVDFWDYIFQIWLKVLNLSIIQSSVPCYFFLSVKQQNYGEVSTTELH